MASHSCGARNSACTRFYALAGIVGGMKTHRTCTPLLALLLAPFVLAAPAAAVTERLTGYSGRALQPEGAALMYTEHHLVRERGDAPSERLVLYRCADGTAFARKRVDYADAEFAPSFELVDARLDYREGLRREGSQLLTFAGVGDAPTESGLDTTPALVADAGFDRFVRRHWETLQAGEVVPIDFVVPSRGESLQFRMRKVEGLDLNGAPSSRIRLSLGGVLGLFAPPMDVIYRDSDRWLLRFEGLTNIRESVSRNLSAHIDFPQAPVAQADGAWDDALAEPLQSCRIPG